MASSQGQKIGGIGILPWLMKVATYLTIVLISTSTAGYLTEYGSSIAKDLVFPVAAGVMFLVGLYTGNKRSRITGVFFAAMLCLWAVGAKTAVLWILTQNSVQLMQSTPMMVGVLIMVVIVVIDFVRGRRSPR